VHHVGNYCIENVYVGQIRVTTLRCVILVVLSNNKNKLMVHMCIVKNTTIFLIVRLLLLRYNYMFRPSMLAIFRLHMKHLMISYVYTWVGGLQFVGWFWCEISFCVCRRSVDRVCLGGVVKHPLNRSDPHPFYKHKMRSRTQTTPQTVNPPLTCRHSLSLSASCTTWRWPTLMAETCSCTLVIVNVL